MVNAFSFCLYGPANQRYYTPLIENLKIALAHFPEWKVWIHYAPDVDPTYLAVLTKYPNAVLCPTNMLGPANMISRFYTIDNPEVDVMFVRDADSLLNFKDRWAIQRFLGKTEFVAHTIRDHKEHGSNLMGGLWGIRKSAGLNIQEQYQMYLDSPVDMGVAHDQNFLSSKIYPLIRSRLLVHYSNNMLFLGEAGEVFPFAWSDDLYCGRIEFPPQVTPRLVNGRFTTHAQ